MVSINVLNYSNPRIEIFYKLIQTYVKLIKHLKAEKQKFEPVTFNQDFLYRIYIASKILIPQSEKKENACKI
jgi:hypothetical protein